MKNIILIGMMGCGKTTCGRLLARRLGRELVDTDALLVEREGRSIPDILAQSGEDYFRAREVEAAGELARREGLIVACGGGPVSYTHLPRLGIVAGKWAAAAFRLFGAH